MFVNIISFVFTLTLARIAFAGDLALLTPVLTQCKETKVEWSGGVAGYAAFIVPYNDPCGDAVVEFPQTTKNSISWNVTLPAGAKVDLMVEDADANEAWTATITVGDSDDTSCIDPKAVSVLKAAGALATESNPASAASSASAEGSGSSIYAAPIVSTPVAHAGSYPTSGVSSSGSSDGIANAASPDTSQTSGSLPRAQTAGSIVGLAVLLVAMLQL